MDLRVAMTGDSNYVYPLGVALHSLATRGSERVQLDFALPIDWPAMIHESEIEGLEHLASSLGWNFRLTECPIEAEGLPRTLHISPITFVKLAYFDVCDAEVSLFIDADAVAVGEWESMRSYGHDYAIAAARETNMREFEISWNSDLQNGWYANAGMLVCRPDAWRRLYSDRWRYLLETYDRWGFTLLEQDILNATLLGHSDLLPNAFNVRPNYGQGLQGARIVHYAGWWKPWFSSALDFSLPSSTRAAFEIYRQAEREFQEFITQPSFDGDPKFWASARRRLRGSGDTRVFQHVGRGLLSRLKNAGKKTS